MSTKTKTRFVWLFVLAIALVPADLAMMAMLRSNAPDVAARWAVTLSQQERSQAVDEIHRYPMAFRRALIAILSPAERAATWKGVFDRYVREHPALLPSQRTAIDRARAYLTPELFSGVLASEAQKAEIEPIVRAVTAEIGKADAAVLFHSMGPEVSTDALPLTVRLAEWATRNEEALAYECECALDSDWCPQDRRCENWPGYCNVVEPWPACGAFYMYACNGLCMIDD